MRERTGTLFAPPDSESQARIKDHTWLATRSIVTRVIGILPPGLHLAAVTLGLAGVAAAWGAYLSRSGHVLQGDLSYPLILDAVLGEILALRTNQGAASLQFLSLLPVYALGVGLTTLLGGGSSDLFRTLVFLQPLAAFTSMYCAVQLLWRWGDDETSGACSRRILAGLLAGWLFALNPWAVARVEHLGLLLGWSATPIALGFLAESLRSGRLRWAVAAGIVTALFVGASPHYLLYMAVVMLLGVVAFLGCRGSFQIASRTLVVFGAVFVGLFAYVLVPNLAAIASGDGSLTADTSDLKMLLRAQSPLNSLLLTSNFARHHLARPDDATLLAWTVTGLIFPLALAASPFQRHGPRGVSILALMVGLGAWLVLVLSGISSPVPLYEWLVSLPFGRLFREPDKLAGILALSLAWGIGIAAANLAPGNRFRNFSRWLPRIGIH